MDNARPPQDQLPDRPRELVVTGLDGSGCARHAAEWAAAEADRRHGHLLLLHAYALPAAGYSGYNPFPANMLPDLREAGEAILQDTADALLGAYPSLEITTRMVYGDAVRVIGGASEGAVLSVVGAHGANRVRVALGSVAAAVAASNPVPVVVIHPGDPDLAAPVVVGVDGSATSEAAIAFAFEAAALRAAPLTAVHSWTDRDLDGPLPGYLAAIVDPDPIQQTAQALLSERLAGWADKYPDVAVRELVVHDPPTPALLECARTAQLMVVGCRGHRGISGMLLGSTSQALIGRGPCPVVVVRPGIAG